MQSRKVRVRPVAATKLELQASDRIWRHFDDKTYYDLISARHPGIEYSRRWILFNVKHHLESLKLDEGFMRGITPQSRVLILGEGSGRLADYFFRKTALVPENLTLVDQAYGRSKPGLKKQVFLLWKQGRLKLRKKNYFAGVQGKFDHILLPESVFGPNSRENADETYGDFQKLLKKHLPNLLPGGTFRATYLSKLYPGEHFPKMDRFKASLDGLAEQGYTVREEHGAYIITSPIKPVEVKTRN